MKDKKKKPAIHQEIHCRRPTQLFRIEWNASTDLSLCTTPETKYFTLLRLSR